MNTLGPAEKGKMLWNIPRVYSSPPYILSFSPFEIPPYHLFAAFLVPLFFTIFLGDFTDVEREAMNMNAQISEDEQKQLIEKLEIFKIHGKDKHGRKILRIIGKFFPARFVTMDVLKTYLEEKIFPRLGRKAFAVLYVHTGVQRSENFPGIAALRSIYEAIPVSVRDNLQEVYFLHPGLQSRLFLATCGRLLFSGGLYRKLRYISRLDYLWEHVRRNEVEMPEFVYDHDEDLEYRPMMDHGLESDHPRVYAAPAVDSPVSMFSMRCIS